MLLALDVGNTQTVVGMYDGETLREHWRTTTVRTHTGDEALVVGPGVRTGVALRVDNPLEVGPDRVANCVAAYALHGGPCIVVDFGTAINFDTVSPGGEFIGGAIAPGLQVALDALGDR